MSFGLKLEPMFVPQDDIFNIEYQGFLRYYFLPYNTQSPKYFRSHFEPYINGGIGLDSAFRKHDVHLTRAALAWDFGAGLDWRFAKNWLLEAEIRGGLPNYYGFSISVGFYIPQNNRKLAARLSVISTDYIIFGPDNTVLNSDVDKKYQQSNTDVLDTVISALKDNPGYSLRIQGYANPVTHTKAELKELQDLSVKRAHAVYDYLAKHGIRKRQMIVVERNGENAGAATESKYFNRRVNLMVYTFEDDA
jgi:outer membrane protein OmpA-like peptidoglycan-associated protein